jgi:hypothetical protein
MKYFITIAVVLFAVSTEYAGDHVTIKFRNGGRASAYTVDVTIGQSFDKSVTLIPEVFQRLEAIQKLKTKSFAFLSSGYLVTIIAEHNGKRLESASCHTLFESNDKLVALSSGVHPLEGVSRQEALSKEPKDFLEFRRLWEEALSMSMKTVNDKLNPLKKPSSLRRQTRETYKVLTAMPVFEKDQDKVPIMTIHRYGGVSQPGIPYAVILSVWKDGRILWSEDFVRGGPPYREAQIEPEKVTKVMNYLKTNAVFGDPALNRFGYPIPDAMYSHICIVDATRCLSMKSHHEMDGRPKKEDLSKHPEEYQHFRFVWDKVKKSFLGLIPKTGGEVLAEKVKFKLKDITVKCEKATPDTE